MSPVLIAALLVAVFTMPAGAAAGNQASPPTPPPPVSSGVTSGYDTVRARVVNSPLDPALRIQATATPNFVRPHHRSPLSETSAAQSSAPSAPAQTITPPAPKAAASTPSAPAGPRAPIIASLITHDYQVTYNGLDTTPPDTQLAAGPTSWMEVVNSMGTIRPRAMGPSGDFSLNPFFGAPAGFLIGDPKVMYERVTGRWYMSALAADRNDNSYVYLAVSTSSEPFMKWNVYGILDHHADGICDQPHLGFSDDKVVVACDLFDNVPLGGKFRNAVFVVLDKAGLMSGVAARYEHNYPAGDTAHFSLQPVYSMTPTVTQYMTYINQPTASSPAYAGLIAIIGKPTNQNVNWYEPLSPLSINRFKAIPRAPQQGTTSTLDSGDIRFLSAVYSSGVIWTTGGDGCIPAGDTVLRACIRMVQLTTGNWPWAGQPARTQDYDFSMSLAPAAKYLFYPAVTMDASGTTYVVYNASSASDFPYVYASDILPALPGAIDQTFFVGSSNGAYVGPGFVGGGSRWGDYSSAAPDPNDPHAIFAAGEISAFELSHANDWGTAAATVSVPGCTSATIGIASMFMGPQYPGPILTVGASATGCAAWAPPQFRFWKLPPNGTWAIVQDYSAGQTYSWDTSKETVLGTYKWEVDVRSKGFTNSYDAVATIDFPLGGPATCPNTVTLTPSSPAPTGAPVLIQASSTCPDPIYRFWIRPPGGSWSVVQDYSKKSSYSWTGGGEAGTYGIEVDVREGLDPASFYGFPTVKSIVLQPCSFAGISASPASPRGPGGTVIVTGTSTCPGTPSYQFWLRTPTGAWSIVQPYSPSSTFNWPTTGLAPGAYWLEVDVRNQGATAGYEASTLQSYFLSTAPCAPTLAAGPPAPGATGAVATFTASATGCPNPRYKFWIQPPGGAWSMVQDYSRASTYSWSGTGMPGVYRIEVDSRDQSESVSYDATAVVTYQLNSCTAAGLSANPASPHMPGGAVVLTGTSTCLGTPLYKFWMRPPDGAWSVVQDYSPTSTFSWQTTGLAVGTYAWEVDVKNQGAANTYEAVSNINYVVGAAPCTSATLTPNPTFPIATGGTQTFYATASGCANPVYRFWVQAPGRAWHIWQDWLSQSTFNLYAYLGGGTYGIEVDVKDVNEQVPYDVVVNTTQLVTPCGSLAVAFNPPGPAGSGSSVLMTATATCPNGGKPNYRIWIKNPYGPWYVVQDYPSMLNTYQWDTRYYDFITGTTKAFAPGTYTIEVDVRNQGTNESYEAVATYTYVLT